VLITDLDAQINWPGDQRFNDAFWDDGLGFYAYALDGDKRKA
jgi:hypothetical protein